MRAEKLREKRSRLPLMPRDLSIHKDVSGNDDDQYKPSTRPDIPVVNSDGNEVFMGTSSLSREPVTGKREGIHKTESR